MAGRAGPGRRRDPLERIACAFEKIAAVCERIEAKLDFAVDDDEQAGKIEKLSRRVGRASGKLKKAGTEAGKK